MLLGIRWGSLRAKIIAWSLVPTAIILFAVAFVTFTAYQRVTEELVIQRDQDLTRLSADRLTAELTEYTDRLTALARMSSIYQGDPDDQRNALQDASNRLVVFDAGVLIFDRFGTVVATEPEQPEIRGQDWSSWPCYREMLGTSGPSFSNIIADGPDGAEVVCVAVPIAGEQGQFVGSIAGMFRLGATSVSSFYGDVVKLRIGESGSTYLVDGQGRVIYHSDTEHIGEDFSAQEVVQQVIGDQVGAIRTRGFKNQDIVASFAPVPGTPWGLVVEESWTSLISSSRPYQQRLLLLLILGLVVPILVATVGVRRITKPILDLTRAAREVAEGSFDQTISAETGDEIEELAQQFNLMSDQLQESYATLERRVADRTKELAALNAIAAVVSRSLDLQEILMGALDKTLEVTGLEAGGIYLLQNQVLSVAAHRGLDEKLVSEIDDLEVGEGFSGRVVETGEPMVVKGLSTDPRLTRSAVKESGFDSVVIVPLVSRRKVLGSLFGITRSQREFQQQEVDLLASIGRQIGVAVENARLFGAEQRRAEQFRVINEVGRDITSILAVDALLDQMARWIQEAFDYYLVEIGLIEEEEIVFEARAGRNWDSEFHSFRLKVDQQSVTGWAAATGEPLLVPDVSQEPRYVRVTTTETRSELVVPMKVKDRVIGVLNVESDRFNTFDESDLVVLQSLANQAAIAIENARLFNAVQRRAEQFRVINEVGSRITSILAVDELLKQMTRLIREAFDYYAVGIALIEGDEAVYRAGSGDFWDDPQIYRSLRLKVGEEGFTGWVAATGEPLLVPDVSQDSRYYHVPEAGDTRSELVVPMKAKETVIGVLGIQSDRLNAFDESDLVMVQALAHQAAIAIENAWLLEAEQRRAEQFRVIGEVGSRITSILDIDEVLKQVTQLIWETLNYDNVVIGLVEEDHVVYKFGAGTLWDDTQFQPYPARLKVGKEGLTGRVAATGEPLLTPDVSQEPGYVWMQGSATRSELIVPIKAQGKVIGVLDAQSERLNGFDESDLAVLQSLANQAGVAIENARLYKQAQQAATLEERQRLARELHDSVTQALYGVTLYGEAAARQLSSGQLDLVADHLQELRETAQEALREMRLLIFELRPPILEEEGLAAALQTRLEAVEERAGLRVSLRVEGEGQLAPALEAGLYRIAQEALNNTLKHAQAESIAVSLRQDGQSVILEIVDDGVGFDPSTAVEYGGLGLDGMEERAEQMGARLTFESSAGAGTTVRVEVSR